MNIFVAKLSFDTKDEDLKQLFAEYGEVSSARVVTVKLSGRSKGYGFVEMENDSEAQNAINALNGTMHFERNIVVAEAKGKKESDSAAPQG